MCIYRQTDRQTDRHNFSHSETQSTKNQNIITYNKKGINHTRLLYIYRQVALETEELVTLLTQLFDPQAALHFFREHRRVICR